MKNLNRLHLNGLRAIEAVGRLGGLKKAADEMGVTVGAVSQQIQKSEQQLGRTLFHRRSRGLFPTHEAGPILQQLTHGMAALSNAVTLADDGQDGTLTVSVPPVFASKWLVWRLKRFNDEHPDVKIRVDATVCLVDPDTSDVDICIRVGLGDWPGGRAEKIMDQYVFPVCSRALAAELKSPADLSKVPIIYDPDSMFDWNVWLEPHGLDRKILRPGPVFSDASLCFDAAIAGQGVFLAWETLASDALAADRLVEPFSGRYATGISYWFVSGKQKTPSRNARLFQRWVLDELDASL